MSFRDFVTGSDACTANDGAGPSNAAAALVNNLLGGASKAQEQLRELPTLHQPGVYGGPSHAPVLSPEAAALAAVAGPSNLHVAGFGPRLDGPSSSAHAFAASIVGPSQSAPAEWDAIFGSGSGQGGISAGPIMGPHGPVVGPGPPLMQLPGGPPPAVTSHLRQFFGRAAMMGPGMAPALPALPPNITASLNVADRCRIRDRATIMARHMFAEQGEAFADQQVNNLLASLHIQPHELPSQLPHAHDASWHEVWAQGKQVGPEALPLAQELAGAHLEAAWNHAQQQAGPRHIGPPGAHQHTLSTGWANEFAEQHPQQQQQGPAGWADQFHVEQQQPGAAWAEEFTEATSTATDTAGITKTLDPQSAMASTQKLVDVLSKDADPKMRNSKFLQFVSKMSKGELIIEDNKLVERPAEAAAARWANEFQQQQPQHHHPSQAAAEPGDARWADEFARNFAQGLDLGPEAELEAAWRQQVNNESQQQQAGPSGGQVDTWVQEFGAGEPEETFQEWERIYGQGHVEDSLQGTTRAKGQYIFSPNNPFLGDGQALAKGKDLFKRGVLSEAALALEAEVQAHPDNAEAWRLLGTVHAENDDDQQAIAAMLKALQANPLDLDVLLALGVSHVNELDTGEAIQHLATWLTTHPTYSQIGANFGPPPDSSQALSHTIRMFKAAAAAHPSDPELAVASGVLHHLNRQYDEAIGAFETALQLRPQDYSLWNKLGATLANNGRSSEAIHAYQKALDLKPNYMRAWTNMGISFANVGHYRKSARFYVRALALNPSSSHVWGYLRTSLACAGALELMQACDDQDLDQLNQALPLE